MKHKFKSVDGAVRRIRELERHVKERDDLLVRWSRERMELAKLAADTPQFYNPLDVAAAKQIRDEILALIGRKGAELKPLNSECGDTVKKKA